MFYLIVSFSILGYPFDGRQQASVKKEFTKIMKGERSLASLLDLICKIDSILCKFNNYYLRIVM